MFPESTVFEFREVSDQPATLAALIDLLRDLDREATVSLLCQVSADLRLAGRDKDSVAKLQQEVAGGLLSDELIARFKERFGKLHMADRPVFHAVQVLNVLRLAIEHCAGTRSPITERDARYKLGTACLMMTELMVTEEERSALKRTDKDEMARALMVQVLSPFEIQNPAEMRHVAYRSRIMFSDLLALPEVVNRIASENQGFDFAQEFLRVTGLQLAVWRRFLLGFYAYLSGYVGQDGARHPEFLAIGPEHFASGTTILPSELNAVLERVSLDFAGLCEAFKEFLSGDWRYDSVPFRGKPLIRAAGGRMFCADLGFLVEKMHSGTYWVMHDAFSHAERGRLSRAWGTLFEEYVNWFLDKRHFAEFVFWPSPRLRDGGRSFDGVLMKGSVLIPMEYKGGFLSRSARYGGEEAALLSDLEKKIAKGCKQLARNIELLFGRNRRSSCVLRGVPLDHITRVVPLLVVQDQFLGGPLVNWWLNKRFKEELDTGVLRAGVTVDPLTVAGVREIETMAESAECAGFDLFHGLQYRCYADPEMRSNLHNFLLNIAGYGKGSSLRVRTAVDEEFREASRYLFGAES